MVLPLRAGSTQMPEKVNFNPDLFLLVPAEIV